MAFAAATASAQKAPFIPYDCFKESAQPYGQTTDAKVTDLSIIPGLDLQNAKLAAITACTDMDTFLISGITTIWGVWDAETNEWTNLQKLNTIGQMSGLSTFSDQALSSEADLALAEYWYMDASPEQKKYYETLIKPDNWDTIRQADFDAADLNKDGVLNLEEALKFFQVVRPKDGKVSRNDQFLATVERAFNIARLLSDPPESMTYSDYVALEDLTATSYASGKLEATGHAKGSVNGADLSHQCGTISLNERQGSDKLTYIRIRSGPRGIEEISAQSEREPLA